MRENHLRRFLGVVAIFACLMALQTAARATLIQIQTVPVGDPGNAADTTGYGAVGYVYKMDKYDVTTAQYTQFLNAVAATDTYSLYSPFMANDLPTVGITRSGSSGSYSYSVKGNGNVPVFYVSWGDAARFSNWLQNGQPTGAEGLGTTETGAYTLNGAISRATLMAITRNAGATYFIPSEDEWYKSAYYKGGGTNAGYWAYATQSNTIPSHVLSASGTNNANYYTSSYTDPINYLTSVGAFASSPSAYGTYDQAGDVYQWDEANIGDSSYRGLRGGSWSDAYYYMPASTRFSGDPTIEYSGIGFRVAEVAEPGSLTLLAMGAIGLLIWARRRKASAA
jgi:formylglycine-generating enzyme required for sulfatase activity